MASGSAYRTFPLAANYPRTHEIMPMATIILSKRLQTLEQEKHQTPEKIFSRDLGQSL